MSKRRLSEALAARSPLARQETTVPVGTSKGHRPESGTGGPPATEEATPHRPEASGSAGGTAADSGARGDGDVVLVAARPAQPRASTAPLPRPPDRSGWPRQPGWQGQAALERWVDAQRELWDAWFALAEHALPVLSPGLPVGWGQPVLRAWQATTRQALDVQAAWLRCWAPRPPGHQPDRDDGASGRSPG